MYIIKVIHVTEAGTTYEEVARLEHLRDALDWAEDISKERLKPVVVDWDPGSQGGGA